METQLFLCQERDETHRLELAGGTAHLLSVSNPEKETANEDAAGVFLLDDGSAVLAVADGAGGHRGGDVAAEVVLRSLGRALEAEAGGEGIVRNALLNGIEAANREVTALGIGAATTISAVELSGDRMRPYHAGDSSILLVGQRGRVKLETTAHSPIGYAVEAGFIEEETALYHDQRHLVSNLLGCDGMHIELGAQVALAPRDTLLLASDGLTDNLRLDEIVEMIRRGPPAAAVARLHDTCRRRMAGGDPEHPSKPDDLTIVLYRRMTS